MSAHSPLLSGLEKGDFKSLARVITIIENDLNSSEQLLEALSPRNVPLVGITGPPGAGKSSLVNALIGLLSKRNLMIGVITVDPSSPFNFGSLLGDRIRMAEHFNNDRVFIRSIATRGSLGGLSDKIIEISDVMKSAPFDYLFVETVGVGQSEVEIAGLADITVVVVVPQTGDEIQTMKSGLMEIADIFVVNKADHSDADRLVRNLKMLVSAENSEGKIPVLKTVATANEGIEVLLDEIEKQFQAAHNTERKHLLVAEKVWRMIEKKRMHDINREKLMRDLQEASASANFNLYRFVNRYISY